MPEPSTYQEWLSRTGRKASYKSQREYEAYKRTLEGPGSSERLRNWLFGIADRAVPDLGFTPSESIFMREQMPTRLTGDITEAERAFAELEATTIDRRRTAAGLGWDATDPGNDAEAAWWEGLALANQQTTRPKPWDDLEAAGADPVSKRVAAFQSELLGRVWASQQGELAMPPDAHDKRVLDTQSAIVKVQTYLATSGERPLTDVDAELQGLFNDPSSREYFNNTILINAWRETRDALSTGNSPVTLSEYARNVTSPTNIANIGLAAPGEGTLSTPSGNPSTPVNEDGDKEGIGVLYTKLASRPSFPRELQGEKPGQLSVKMTGILNHITNPGFTATDARLYDQLYATSVFSEWYTYNVTTPGYISDTSSPQKVREQVQTALTRMTGILNQRQREQLLAMADQLAAAWQDEMASLPDSDGGDFRLQTSFVDWIRGNVDEFIPDIDLAIASEDITIANIKSTMTPLAGRFLDIGLAPKAADELAGLLTRQPHETFGSYTARLQNYMPQLIAVGQAAFARDPKKYAAWANYFTDPITGKQDATVRPGSVLQSLAWDIDSTLADIWMTAAEGDGPDAEIARRALTSTDPADTQAAITRFGRTKQLDWKFGPLEGPVSYEMAGDPSVAEIPIEFLNALRAHAMQVASVLPQGTREVAVERLMSKSAKYYAGFLERERALEAALPEDQRLFGGVPREEFTSIIETSETARTLKWVDPRLTDQQKQAIAAERGLTGIFSGDPEDLVTVDGQERRRQDVVNEIGAEAKARAQAQQSTITTAGGPLETKDPVTGKTTTTAYGSLLSFQEKAKTFASPQPKLAAARARQSSLAASQRAPEFLRAFGLSAQRKANDAFPDFDLEIGASVAAAAPSNRFATSTISPRRRR